MGEDGKRRVAHDSLVLNGAGVQARVGVIVQSSAFFKDNRRKLKPVLESFNPSCGQGFFCPSPPNFITRYPRSDTDTWNFPTGSWQKKNTDPNLFWQNSLGVTLHMDWVKYAKRNRTPFSILQSVTVVRPEQCVCASLCLLSYASHRRGVFLVRWCGGPKISQKLARHNLKCKPHKHAMISRERPAMSEKEENNLWVLGEQRASEPFFQKNSKNYWIWTKHSIDAFFLFEGFFLKFNWCDLIFKTQMNSTKNWRFLTPTLILEKIVHAKQSESITTDDGNGV